MKNSIFKNGRCDSFEGKVSEGRSLTIEWLDTKQAATFLSLPIGTLRNMTSNGKIPYAKLGRLNRYKREDLENLLLSNRRGDLTWE